MTEQDEYAIDAQSFRDALLEQRAMKLKGGLYHLTQVVMAYNSNHIEGSELSPEQTRFIYETHSVSGDVRVDDVIETMNHFRMFDAMLDALGTPLTVQRILRYHEILKTGTSDADKEWFAVGGWKRLANVVGLRETTAPEDVEAAIKALVDAYPAAMTFEDITDFHYRFESIHPFQDGNGRVGRIIMFGQCLANDILPFIILDKEKQFYYRGLTEYESEPGYLRDTFRHFQDSYYAAFAKFVAEPGGPLTRSMAPRSG
ncbi:MAG: Fic family protein [Propionibacteriaceae bacterium]|jgi:Fic family protein|nr:Fic family protein [Propionibacteriaceae bacterium]